ncbi:hypothetical protein SAMN05444422_102105 [Halobiforma haloterrestris]|uniref:Uncharacterized protein n=1 Tax=Natronobacterium haloterrestre TaxID=148448 RepID=A0A1I1E5E7_NATHA|nr:hypothetical protein [Halobiforma haloterrestris]SFB80458.1 hypothetical protein SAMN05444422_102105 [Halobiforma haloterrestris]
MYGSIQFAGYLALLVTPATLLLGAVRGPPELRVGAVGLPLGVALVGTVVAATERPRLSRLDGPGLARADAVDALAVPAAAVVTYGLSVHGGLGPVLAAAVVGLLVGGGLPRIDGPAYCGTFVGMASPAVFPSLEAVALAGTVAGLAFVATTDSFAGFGGKYGTVALFGCIVAGSLLGVDYAAAGALDSRLVAPVVLVAVVAAVATVALRTRGGASSVVASAAVGVVAGVAFPSLFPELGTTLAAVAFCASFVGMSSDDRLATTGQVAAAGLLCGLVYLAVAPSLAGAGGKLGTTAFVSCLAVAGVLELSGLLPSSGRDSPAK